MKLNVFEGARRIGLAFGSIWIIGCLAFAVFSEPSALMTYAVEWPGQPGTKVESCAKEDATEYAALKTAKGGSVGVRICLTAHEAVDGRRLIAFASAKDVVWDKESIPAAEGRPWEKYRANKEDDSWYKDSPIVTPEKQTAATSVGLPSSLFKDMSDAELLAAYQKEKAQAMNGQLKYLMKERYSSEVTAYGRQVAAHFSLSEDGMKDAEQAVWGARFKQWKDALQFALGGVGLLWAAAAGIGWVVRGFMGIPRGKDTRPA